MAIWYVSSLASGSGAGTSASPWTLAQAVGASLAAGDVVNVKANGTYYLSATLTLSAGQVWWQGYTATPGDGGRATFQFATAVSNGLIISGSGVGLADIIIVGGTLVSDNVIATTGYNNLLFRVKTVGGGSGFYGAQAALYEQCECTGASASNIGIKVTNRSVARRCRVTGGGNAYQLGSGGTISSCVADGNAGPAVSISDTSGHVDSMLVYGNTSAFDLTGASRSAAILRSVVYQSGTMAVQAASNAGAVVVSGLFTDASTVSTGLVRVTQEVVSLAASPFVWPSAGDFRLTAYGKNFPGLKAIMAGMVGTPGITTDSLADLFAGGVPSLR